MQNYYYQPTRPIPQQQSLFLKGRPVSSLDEVRAAAIDFDGSISFFPDLANGRIYTKQCNVDGTAALNMYELKEIPTETSVENNNFITRTEFNKAMESIKQAFNSMTKIEPKSTSVQTSQENEVNNNPPEFHF